MCEVLRWHCRHIGKRGLQAQCSESDPTIPLDPPPLPPSSPVSPRSRHQGRDPGFDRPPRPAPAAIHALPTACRSNLQCALCVPSCAKLCQVAAIAHSEWVLRTTAHTGNTQTERSAPARLPARYSAWPTFTTDAPYNPPTIQATQKGLHDVGGQCRSAAPPPCNRVSL